LYSSSDIYCDDEVKEDELGGACSMNVGDKLYTKR